MSVRAHERSLATIFSKLDRDVDLEWLSERSDVQRTLAELLGCTVSDIQAGLTAGPMAPDRAARRVRLDDLRYARALDLAEEGLPPGIPDAVLHPELWGRLWWAAPSGSGRTLVGRWLEARGLAVFAHGEIRDLRSQLSTRAPVFVELAGVPIATAAELLLRDRICVAAPGPPPASPPGQPPWRVVDSPALAEVLPGLVSWVSERLESDGHFEPERALGWLEQRAMGDIDSLGTALGLCGLIDELGFRSLEGKTLAEAGRRYVALRLGEWRRAEGGDTSGIERQAFDVLVGIVMRTLTDDQRPWSAARSFDEWLGLVPIEHRQGADVDWLRLSLPEVDRTIRPSDIEKAARRMPPGAYRIVRALRGARLLTAGAHEDELVLAPRWLGVIAEREAMRELMGLSPFEWGEALLRPHAAAGTRAALFERIQSGDLAPVAAALELGDDDNPAYVAALENGFRAVGLGLLAGLELPPELAEELWSEQARLWLALDGSEPRPRVLEPDAEDEWKVASLALGEALARAPEPTPALLDAALAVFRGSPSELAGAIAALVDRSCGTPGARSEHRIELPATVADEIASGGVSFDRVRTFDEPERDLAALQRIAAQRGLDFERVARAIWQSWQRAGRPPLPRLLATPSTLRALWVGLSPELVPPLFERAAGDGIELPLDALSDAQWSAFVVAHAKLGASAAHAWDAIPLVHALKALTSEPGPSGYALERLWARFPDALGEAHAAELSLGQPERAVLLLAAAPDAISPRLLRTWRERMPLDRVPDKALDELRRVLHARVIARRAGFREAYALLADAERLVAGSRL